MYYASLEFKVDKFLWKVISQYILETELKKPSSFKIEVSLKM